MYHIKVRSPSLEWGDVFGTISAHNSSQVEEQLKKENQKMVIKTIIRVEELVKN